MLYSNITRVIKSSLEENGSYLLRDFMELSSLKCNSRVSFCKNSNIRMTNKLYESLGEKFPKYKFFHYSDLPVDYDNYWIYTGIDSVYNFSYSNESFGVGLGFFSDKLSSVGFYFPISHRFFWTEYDKPVFLGNYKLNMFKSNEDQVNLVASSEIILQLVKNSKFVDLCNGNFSITKSVNISICHATLGYYNTILFNNDDSQSVIGRMIGKNYGFVELEISDDISCLTLPGLVNKIKSFDYISKEI